jgi:hypothetical protein
MPSAWLAWSPGELELSAELGYAHGLGDRDVHAGHGEGDPWPLVDPMNFSEVTFGGGAMIALARALRVGVRAGGAVPIRDGARRLFGGARVTLREGRIEIAAELLLGVTDEPYRLRGVVTTSMAF